MLSLNSVRDKLSKAYPGFGFHVHATSRSLAGGGGNDLVFWIAATPGKSGVFVTNDCITLEEAVKEIEAKL